MRYMLGAISVVTAMLSSASQGIVLEWSHEPILFDGKPVVQTTILLTFTLSAHTASTGLWVSVGEYRPATLDCCNATIRRVMVPFSSSSNCRILSILLMEY